MRDKDRGIWQEYTWEDYFHHVMQFALGLKELGFQRGDKICIIGDNEPQWYWAELAAQALGGAVVGIFVDSLPEELRYIATHADARFVVARDQEQVDKVLRIKDALPTLQKVIYWYPKGLWHYDDPLLMSFCEVESLGRECACQRPEAFQEEVSKGREDDVAVICYTSGTTGAPKGVMVSHKNLIVTIRQFFLVDPWKEGDNYLSYVPPAWITEQMLGIAGSLVSGAIVNFPERAETMQRDIREIGPSMVLYTSRMWESLCTTIMTKIDDGQWLKRMLFNLCLPIGYRVIDAKMQGRRTNLALQVLYWLADLTVFRHLRDKIGLRRTRSCYTGGSLISPGTFRFFRAIGLDLRQIYGSSEAGLCCCHRKEDVRYESIGVPLPGMELRIASDGEMLWKGDCLFLGYYKEPEKTAQALVDGWYRSGDAGYIDEQGHIIYLDRISDMMELGEGQKYPPQHIEGRLKFSPYIRDVIAIGGGSLNYVVALVQIDFDSVGKWAERNRIPYTTFADLSQKKEVYDLVEKEIRALNRILPEGARVRKFVCLPKELDPDEQELTRTRKLRRDFLEKKFGELLEAIRLNRDTHVVSSEVKYRDGSIGLTTTEVRIRTV